MHVCAHESLPCWLLVHVGGMLSAKCSLWFTREIAIATASRSKVVAGTFSVWVVCGTSNSDDRNCFTSSCFGKERFVAEDSACWPVLAVVSCGVQCRDTPRSAERQQAWRPRIGSRWWGPQPVWRTGEFHSPVEWRARDRRLWTLVYSVLSPCSNTCCPVPR